MKITSLFSSKEKSTFFTGKLPMLNEHTIFYGPTRNGKSAVDAVNSLVSSPHAVKYDIRFIPVLSVPDLSMVDDDSILAEGESLKITYPLDSYNSKRFSEYSVFNYYADRSIIPIFESLAKLSLNCHLRAVAVDIVADHLKSHFLVDRNRPIYLRVILDALYCEAEIQPFVESVRTKIDEIGRQSHGAKGGAQESIFERKKLLKSNIKTGSDKL